MTKVSSQRREPARSLFGHYRELQPEHGLVVEPPSSSLTSRAAAPLPDYATSAAAGPRSTSAVVTATIHLLHTPSSWRRSASQPSFGPSSESSGFMPRHRRLLQSRLSRLNSSSLLHSLVKFLGVENDEEEIFGSCTPFFRMPVPFSFELVCLTPFGRHQVLSLKKRSGWPAERERAADHLFGPRSWAWSWLTGRARGLDEWPGPP
ncbi:hypothetical protein AAHA92_31490 [Salvia divinorum]|uniref:Uncharacterized protein n=1 Tax=Salvia divinorum TaxID=28513 RepID=A0ABD1FQI4_SALDI